MPLAIHYARQISVFRNGWQKLDDFEAGEIAVADVCFSIIIPARNESQNIISCLQGLVLQSYAAEQFEIIVADDFSEDETPLLVQQFITNHPGFRISLLKMAELPEAASNSFKKFAITQAIARCSYEWIITSDADCEHGTEWLRTIAAFIKAAKPVLISAPVRFTRPESFFEQVQAMEFMGLIGIGAASMANKTPNMCNGANLVYSKKAFYEVNGFAGNDDIASGDDEFLMHKMAARWPDKIAFLKSTAAVATTRPAGTMQEFIHQRRRWVSKSRKYQDNAITKILVWAWIFHGCLLVSLLVSVINPLNLVWFALAFGIKALAEYRFLVPVSDFFGRRKLLHRLLPSAFLYTIYVVIIGVLGNTGKYQWKGRRVR